MNIIISNQSDSSIYEQIYKQIRENIIIGNLKTDQPLPSIRNLAKDLKISVITTKRAYEELERDGFIYTIPAKGSFVAKKDIKIVKENCLRQIENHLVEVINLKGLCEISDDEVFNIYKTLQEEM